MPDLGNPISYIKINKSAISNIALAVSFISTVTANVYNTILYYQHVCTIVTVQ